MARSSNARRSAAALPLWVVVLGTLASIVASSWLRGQIEHSAEAAFARRADLIEVDLRRRLSLAIYGLNGARGAYASHHPFTHQSFAAYVASRDLAREFPGVRNFGFTQRVPSAQLAAFESVARADGAPDFRLKFHTAPSPAQQQLGGDHFVVRYLQPGSPKSRALGLDVSFEPMRRQAIDRAIATGKPALTAPISLLLEDGKANGFLLFVPVFEPGLNPETPNERREALVGLLFAPLVATEVLDGVSTTSAQDFGFTLSLPDVSGNPGELMFRHGLQEPGAVRNADAALGRHQLQRMITLPGYDALLRVRSSSAFDAEYPMLSAWLVLLGGICTSAFLAALFHLQGTSQRRAESMAERMTAELARLAMVAERTSNAVLITDRNLHITWVNDGFTRLYGHSLEQALGHTPGELLGTPRSDPAAIQMLAEAAAAGTGCRVEVVNRARDGRDIWLDCELQPTLDEHGAVVGFVEIASDITERRQAEIRAATLLRENQALLGTIRTHTKVSMTDAAGVIIEVNDAFCTISGHPREALLGQTHALLNSGVHDAAFWQSMWQTIAGGRPWRGEICNRARDGSLFWVDSMIAPIMDAEGRIETYVSIRSDITDSKQAALELATQRQRLADIVDGIEAGTWECDLVSDRSSDLEKGRVRISAAYAAMTGRSIDECRREMKPSFLAMLHPADVAHTSQALDSHLQGLTPSYAAEYRVRHKLGHWVWLQSRGKVSERAADGAPLRISGIVLDVSVRKHAERELAHQRQALENIIEGTNAATWEWNVDTGQVRFNARWMQMVGCAATELDAPVETWVERTHRADLARVKEALLCHFRGETAHLDCEYRMRHADGSWIWLLSRGKIISRNAEGRARWLAGTHIDISQRRRAEEALAASQAFLDQTGRVAGVGGWEVDLATRTVTWSDHTCRIHDLPPGHRPSVEEAMSYYPGEAQATLEEAVEHSTRTGEGFDLELPLITAGGRAIWIRSVGSVERVDGQPVRLFGAFQDTTARHQLEDKVRHNHALMSTVLANLPCALSVFDGEERLRVSNALFGELLDLPEALNAPGATRFEDIVRFNAQRGEYGAGDAEAIVSTHLARISKPIVPHQFERERPGGLTLEVRGAPMPGGGFLTTYTDISARRRAEADVERSERLLRAAIDAIDEAFVLYDPEDHLVFCNDKYRQIYPIAASLAQPGNTFESIIRRGAEGGEIPAAVGRVDEWVAERLRAHQAGETTPLQQLADGRSLRVLEKRLPDGHIVGFRIDVTEMVRATEAANAASQAKSQFVANLSHEIRTPMNAILGMLALLRKTELNPRQADYAAKTEGAARSLLGLLNDILDFSKIEAGKMTLDLQPFALDTLLQDLSVILSANLGKKPVELLFDIDPDVPPWLLGDAMRLQQVLINLAGNAVKFTQRGEVVVSVALCHDHAATHGGEVTLEVAVRDTGIGIAPENQVRIFDGFTQAEASTTRRFGGTGLGVAISQRLVTLMGGALRLDSTPGLGSCFHFRLKLAPAPAPSSAPVAAAAVGDAVRALVIDDNPTARGVLRRMGRSLGWKVDTAASGEAALVQMQEAEAAGRPFDAVFVDWQMPGLDGWQTSRRIRDVQTLASHRREGAALVVMVTAHGREMLTQRDASEQALLDGFLVKPVTAAMLADALSEARGTASASSSESVLPDGSATQGAPVVSPQRLAGLRLLLVEDNLNNQQVASELLQDEGAQVQIAADGQLAVAAVAAANPMFDAVLMDLQMPVMDGFTATCEIRQTLGLGAERLPIVAMTANAMASDREACLAAGMNEHVGKPFDIERLVTLLLRVCGRPDPVSAARAAAAEAFAAATPPGSDEPSEPSRLPAPALEAARVAGVQVDAALARLGGWPKLYRRMLGNFLAELETAPTLLQSALDQADLDAAARLAHTWRGTAATLGVVALSGLAATAEAVLRDAQEEPSAAVGALLSGLGQARSDLASLHAALDPAPTPAAAAAMATADSSTAAVLDDPAQRQALRADLNALAVLLQQSDMAALDANAQLQARFNHLQHSGSAPGVALRSLDQAIGSLDFASALHQCEALCQRYAT